MKAELYNKGACGIEQVMYLGKVDYTATGNTKLENTLPAGFKLTRVIVNVKSKFNAETTNTISIGAKDEYDKYMSTSEITAGTEGAYIKNMFTDIGDTDVEVYATYSQSGTAATTGEAEIWAYVVRTEV